MPITGNQLISEVQLTITMPNNQVLLTDDRILAFANSEIKAKLVPLIVSTNQEYFVYLDESLTTQSGVDEYPIPVRAIGRILRELKLRDGGNTFDCNQIQLEDVNFFQYSGNSFCYYFRGDKFIFVPMPQNQDFKILRWYLMQPSDLVKTDACGKITGLSGNVVTVDVVPDTFVAGIAMDIVQGVEGHTILSMDNVITNVSGNQVTLTTAPDATKVAIGDYLCLARQSPVLMAPDECLAYLTMITASRCLYSIGDYEGQKALDEKIPEARTVFQQIIAPRNQGEAIKVFNRNGLLRGRRNGFWRGVLR